MSVTFFLFEMLQFLCNVSFAFFLFLDRTTAIGQSINSYLQGTTELEDHAIHLLFSANRWESVYVTFPKLKFYFPLKVLIVTTKVYNFYIISLKKKNLSLKEGEEGRGICFISFSPLALSLHSKEMGGALSNKVKG